MSGVLEALLGILVIALAVVGALALLVLLVGWRSARRERRQKQDFAPDFDGDFDLDDARRTAAELDSELEWWEMSLDALEAHSAFQRAVRALADEDFPIAEVVSASRNSNGWLASMALAALARRGDVPDEWLAWATRHPVRPSVCEDALLLRALATHSLKPVIPPILRHLDSLRHELVAEFVRLRRERGEPIDATTFQGLSLTDSEELERFSDEYAEELGAAFRAAFETGVRSAT